MERILVLGLQVREPSLVGVARAWLQPTLCAHATMIWSLHMSTLVGREVPTTQRSSKKLLKTRSMDSHGHRKVLLFCPNFFYPEFCYVIVLNSVCYLFILFSVLFCSNSDLKFCIKILHSALNFCILHSVLICSNSALKFCILHSNSAFCIKILHSVLFCSNSALKFFILFCFVLILH